jgi:hypothetical protein
MALWVEVHLQEQYDGARQREVMKMEDAPPLREPYPAPAGACWFDVSLWVWPPTGQRADFPKWAGAILGRDAGDAIVNMMRFYGLRRVGYAIARSYDGTVVYSCESPVVLF